VEVDAEGPHFCEQDQVARAAPTINQLASVDQAAFGGVLGLHEQGGQPHSACHQKVDGLWLGIGEAAAKRPQHGDAVPRLRCFEQPGAPTDAPGEQVGAAVWRDREQRDRSRQKWVTTPVAAQHNELSCPASRQGLATAEAEGKVLITQCAIPCDSRVKIAHTSSADGSLYSDLLQLAS
jgi:hypothetical protein